MGDYDVDSVILDLGSDVNILTKKTWERMGKLQLVWSPVQLWLENQARVSPIGRVPHLLIELQGMKTYADFDVIEIIDESSSYPALLKIGWDNDNLEIINFNKRVTNFENCNILIISPLDPSEGRRYIKLVKEEFVGGWDHTYNILEDYIHPIVDGELG